MNTTRLLQFAAIAAAFTVLPGAKAGCGSQEANETLKSSVQAVTTVLERADGTIDAELVLITTAHHPNEFVDGARNVMLRVPGGAEVELTLAKPGHYAAKDDAALKYVPDETYRLGFDLDDDHAAGDVSGGDFVAVADAPDDDVELTIAEAPEFAGDTAVVEWSPSRLHGIVTVRHESGATWRNFDFREPEFDGSKWARLKKGGSLELGVDVFSDPGTYTVEVCAVSKVSDFDTALSKDLGALSGFLIGRCAAPQTLDVE